MAQPTNSTPLVDLHPTLHNREVNVKSFGATGDGSTDDAAAIQSALTAMTSGGQLNGTLVFPAGNYKVTTPILIGDGATYVTLRIVGQSYFSASNGAVKSTQISPSGANVDAFRFNAWAGHGHSLVVEGLQIVYPSVGTGIGWKFDQGAQTTGPIVRDCIVQNAGVGFEVGDSVNARFSNCTAVSCDKGFVLKSGTPNLPQFENVTFQACVTAGLSVETFVSNARFASCVFQSNTGPGILTTGAGALLRPTFDTCWWEFPGTDMIRISGITAGLALDHATFTNCVFDGSGNNRNIINVQASAASGIFGRRLTFINCTQSNIGTGNFLHTATDPTNSNDPGFLSIVIIGGSLGNMKGLHTPTSAGASPQSVFIGNGVADSNVLASTVYGTKASYVLLRGDESVALRNDLGAIDFTEVTAPAAGATNHARLYAEDNGAGKTRLVVRFPTGAAQVIATEP